MGIHAPINGILRDIEVPLSVIDKSITSSQQSILIVDVLTLVYDILESHSFTNQHNSAMFLARFIGCHMIKSFPLSLFSTIYLTSEGAGHRKKYKTENDNKKKCIYINKNLAEHNLSVSKQIRDFIYANSNITNTRIFVVSGENEADIQIASIIEMYYMKKSKKLVQGEIRISKFRSEKQPQKKKRAQKQKILMTGEPLPKRTKTPSLPVVVDISSQLKQFKYEEFNTKRKITPVDDSTSNRQQIPQLIIWTTDSDILITAGCFNCPDLDIYWFRRGKLYDISNINNELAMLFVLFGCDHLKRIAPIKSGIGYNCINKKITYNSPNISVDVDNKINKTILPTKSVICKKLKEWHLNESHATSILKVLKYYTHGNLLMLQ